MTAKPSKKSLEAFSDWHWGLEPASVVDWADEQLPDELIECGRLAELRFRIPSANSKGNPARRKDSTLTLTKPESNKSHLAYDPNHPSERLYILLEPKLQKKVATTYYAQNPFAEQSLADVAKFTGGRHGTARDYPEVMVKPIGICTAVIYATEKEGDGFSFYIHRLGEETGVRPCLCVSEDGRLWLAGGNYTSPTAGITD